MISEIYSSDELHECTTTVLQPNIYVICCLYYYHNNIMIQYYCSWPVVEILGTTGCDGSAVPVPPSRQNGGCSVTIISPWRGGGENAYDNDDGDNNNINNKDDDDRMTLSPTRLSLPPPMPRYHPSVLTAIRRRRQSSKLTTPQYVIRSPGRQRANRHSPVDCVRHSASDAVHNIGNHYMVHKPPPQ